MGVRLIFRGGAGTVTGSCYLIEHDDGRFLVDCGMFQGNRTTRELNYTEFPFDPAGIGFVLLTHAHIDHSGLLPKLARRGFAGPIHATAPTVDLLSYMLPDSGAIQESEVERLNRRLLREGKPPVLPIYTKADAEATVGLASVQQRDGWFDPGPGVRARFWNAGHILGSVSIELEIGTGGQRPLRLLFSGDLGPDEKVFHMEPDAPEGIDYLICESTYGDRDRADMTVAARRGALEAEVAAARARGGNLVIPSFAVERSQELLHDIGVLMAEGRIPDMPVFLDSPLAGRVTSVFIKHGGTLGDVALDEAELFRNPNFRIVEDVEGSKAINRISGGAIIVSASGMAEAGRIRHHLRNNLWRPEATVLFVGYQAPGTLGALIQGGAEHVRIHGEDVAVKATIRSIGNYSAHADQRELLDWVLERRPVAAGIFLTHGEEPARTALKALLVASGFDPALIHLPQLDDAFELRTAAGPLLEVLPRRVAPERMVHDWADDYAAFSQLLSKRLERLPDDAARAALMRDLNATLERQSREVRGRPGP